MNEVKFKKHCLKYIRYSAILEHLKSSDASWGQMREVTRIMEQIIEDMKKELDN